MCTTCKKVIPGLDEDTTKSLLQEIADAISAGKSAAHFTKAMDTLLGTEMEERDRDREAAWEQGYRNRNSAD